MKIRFTDNIENIEATLPALSDGETNLNYQQMTDLAGKAASYFKLNYKQQQYVIMKAYSNVDFIINTLGAIYSGKTPVPIDPNLPHNSLQHILEKCNCPEAISPIPAHQYNKYPHTFEADATAPVMVMFTSGTTGQPKGVLISHENLIHSCKAISNYLQFKVFPKTAAALPLYYSYGLLSQVLCHLFIGGYVRIIPSATNPWQFAEIVKREELRSYCGVPSSFLSFTKMHGIKPLSMPSVKIVCSAGAAFNLSQYQKIKEVFPSSKLFNNYGLTEATPRVSFIDDQDSKFFEGTCGRPMKGVKIKVADPFTHEEKKHRDIGVLLVKGPNITSGYLNEPGKTKASFTRDGYFISGDLAYIDNGYIYLKGRIDDVFKAGGNKISPLEIEGVLHSIKEITDSAVTGLPDQDRGQKIIAFVILRSKISKNQIVSQLQKELPKYKIPEHIYIVERLPMTNNGKVLRRCLSPHGEYVKRELL